MRAGISAFEWNSVRSWLVWIQSEGTVCLRPREYPSERMQLKSQTPTSKDVLFFFFAFHQPPASLPPSTLPSHPVHRVRASTLHRSLHLYASATPYICQSSITLIDFEIIMVHSVLRGIILLRMIFPTVFVCKCVLVCLKV